MAADAGSGAGTAAGEDPVIASARSGEPDRYLAALLAPPAARGDLLALAAFTGELARVPSLVTREPTMGEIRLQWWRDALAAPALGARTGNPVADAICATVHRHDLPAPLLLDMIDAREVDLALHELADDNALAAYLWKSEGAPFALAAGILRPGASVDAQAAAAASGQAYGLARLLLGLPHALARGRVPLPQSRLDACAVRQSGAAVGRGRQQRRGADRQPVRRGPQGTCHQPRTGGEFAASGSAGVPSFGLGRAVFASAGATGPRSVAVGGRDRAAHARVEDRRGALAWPHLTPRGDGRGCSSREQNRCGSVPA